MKKNPIPAKKAHMTIGIITLSTILFFVWVQQKVEEQEKGG